MNAEQLLAALEQKSMEVDVLFVTGLAKKRDGRTDEILFAQAPSYAVWVSLPVGMIEYAQLLGWSSESGTPAALVRLALRTPSTPEGSALANLVRHGDIKNQRGDGTLPTSMAGAGSVQSLGDGTLPIRTTGLLPPYLAVGTVLVPLGHREGNG